MRFKLFQNGREDITDDERMYLNVEEVIEVVRNNHLLTV
jgi:hypothetical protein